MFKFGRDIGDVIMNVIKFFGLVWWVLWNICWGVILVKGGLNFLSLFVGCDVNFGCCNWWDYDVGFVFCCCFECGKCICNGDWVVICFLCG